MKETMKKLFLSFLTMTIMLYAALSMAGEPYMVRNIHPGTYRSSSANFRDVNGTLFFTIDNQLWKSNGTEGGTVMVKDMGTYRMGLEGGSKSIHSYVNVNGTLFFAAEYDGDDKFSLWKSDGTADGTVMVRNYPSSFCWNFEFQNVNGTLFFGADEGINGCELWKSDGTADGTVIVKDIYPGMFSNGVLKSSSPYQLTNMNGTLFFSAAYDDAHSRGVWRSDGTAAGTVMIKDINPSDEYGGVGSLTNVNGTLFFVSGGSRVSGLYISNGAVAAFVKDVAYLDKLTNVNGTLFFSATSSHLNSCPNGLWKSNGTEAGTVMVSLIRSDGNCSGLSIFTNVNGTLFFTADDGVHGNELWKSDGTAAGTVMVKDINPGASDSMPYFPMITNVDGTLYFVANDGIHGRELWKSDGTAAGTVMVKDINPGVSDSDPDNLTNINGTLFFTADDGVHGTTLWALSPNGTPATPGDLNGDGKIDISDVIIALKILSGLPVDNLNPKADIDGDGKIGMAEAIYVLQKVSELRTQ